MAITVGGTIPLPYAAKAVYGFNPSNQNFIASKVAPAVTATAKSGTLPILKRSATMARLENTKRAPGSIFARGDMQVGAVTYSCDDYGFEHKSPIETAAQFANELDFDVAATMQVRGELFTGREKRLADLLFNTSTWTGSSLFTDVHSSAPWATAGSDIIGTVNAAHKKVRALTGLRANSLIMSYDNYLYALANTAITGKLSGIAVSSPDVVAQFLAKIFGVDNIFVGEAVYNADEEVIETATSDTVTATNIWSNSYVMLARTANSSNADEPAVARLVNFSGEPGTDMSVSKYYENQTDSWIYKGKLCEDEVVVDTGYAHLLQVA